MNITPITATTPACFGVCCPRHAECASYAAAEGPNATSPIATCDDNGTNERPLFVQLVREEVTAA